MGAGNVSGWLCPRCSAAWGPHIDECRRCSVTSAPTGPPEAHQATLTTLLAEFIAALPTLVAAKRLKQSTADLYTRQARVLVGVVLTFPDGSERAFGDLAWHELDKTIADLYRAARSKMPGKKAGTTVKGNTVNRDLVCVIAALTYHCNNGRKLPSNPLHKCYMENERQFRRRTRMTLEEWTKFLSYGHPLLQDVGFVRFRALGMRPAEAWLLRKTELDPSTKTIKLGDRDGCKTGPREIPVPDDAWLIIEKHAEYSRGPYVFVDPADPARMEPVSEYKRCRWVRRCREDSGMVGYAGEELTDYVARHSSINEAVETIPIDDVSDGAGTSIATLQATYLHQNPASIERTRQKLNSQVTKPEPSPPSERVAAKQAPRWLSTVTQIKSGGRT